MTTSNPHLPAKRPAKKVASTTFVNELVDVLGANFPQLRDGQLDNPIGYHIFDGVIVNAGPNGEADLKNNMYWVAPQYIVQGRNTNSATLSAMTWTAPNTNTAGITAVPACNLIEPSSTNAFHVLPLGRAVRVFGEYDAGGTNTSIHYVMNEYFPWGVFTVTTAWNFGDTTIQGTSTGNTNVRTVDLVYPWPTMVGTQDTVPWCSLVVGSTVPVMPYPEGSMARDGLAIGWDMMSPTTSCQPDLTQPLTPVCNDDGTVSFTTTNYVRVVLSANPASCP